MTPYNWQPQIRSSINQDSEPEGGSRLQQEAELNALRGQVDRLTLACQSLWELIRDNGSFTEGELQEKIAEVDLRDGKLDGKLGATVLKCRSCDRNTNSRRDSCVWCGAPVQKQHAFEG